MKSTYLLFLVIPTLYIYYLGLLRVLYSKRIHQDERLDRYLKAERAGDRDEKPSFTLKSVIRRLGKSLIRKDRSERLELQLIKAGIPLRSEEYIIIAYLSAIIPPILIYMLTGNIFAAAVTFVAGLIMPKQLLNAAIKKRLNSYS